MGDPRTQPSKGEIKRLTVALAKSAYERGVVRVASADLRGYSHLVASRQGLFAVNRQSYRLIVHGLFFGLTLRDDAIYVFESCDIPAMPTRRGRVLRLRVRGQAISDTAVLATGLDNGCHQIDFVDDRLCVLDTYNQRVLRFAPAGGEIETLDCLPPAKGREWASGYVHANSLLQVGGRILVLLHNGGKDTGRVSEAAVFDRAWRPLGRWMLPGYGCHDLVCLEDGDLLTCGSQAGELISIDGIRIPISSMMTRGLSVGAAEVAVGASRFSMRRERLFDRGTITFLNRAMRIETVLELPAAPTDIRRLDGQDFALSTYACDRARLPSVPF